MGHENFLLSSRLVDMKLISMDLERFNDLKGHGVYAIKLIEQRCVGVKFFRRFLKKFGNNVGFIYLFSQAPQSNNKTRIFFLKTQ